mgnify:CR=1 FL=1
MEDKFLKEIKRKSAEDAVSRSQKGLEPSKQTGISIDFNIQAISCLRSGYPSTPLVKDLYLLDEEDIEYFREKLSRLEVQQELEYKEKLRALNSEYGKG